MVAVKDSKRVSQRSKISIHLPVHSFIHRPLLNPVNAKYSLYPKGTHYLTGEERQNEAGVLREG